MSLPDPPVARARGQVRTEVRPKVAPEQEIDWLELGEVVLEAATDVVRILRKNKKRL